MMDMKLNIGSLRITDDNRTITSTNIAKEIYEKCIAPDSNDNNSTNTCDSTNNTYRPTLDIND